MRALLIVVAVGIAVGAMLAGLRPGPGAQPPAPGATAIVFTPQTRAPTPVVAPGGSGGAARRLASGHFAVTARINGQATTMLVDTGASVVVLTPDDARRAGIAVDPARFAVIGRGVGGAVRGEAVTIDRMSVAGIARERVRAAVIEGAPVSLLGQSFLGGVDITVRGDTMTLR